MKGFADFEEWYKQQQKLEEDPIAGKERLEGPLGKTSETCQQYIITLLKIIKESFQKFGYIIGSVLRFNHVIFSKVIFLHLPAGQVNCRRLLEATAFKLFPNFIRNFFSVGTC